MDGPMVPRHPDCTACSKRLGALPPATARSLLTWAGNVAEEPTRSYALSRAVLDLTAVADVDHTSVLVPNGRSALIVLASSERHIVGDLMVALDRYPELDQVLQSGEPILIESVEGCELLAQVRHLLRQSGVVSIAAVPFDLGGTAAVWRMVSRSRTFSGADLDLLAAAAHLAEHWLPGRSLLEADAAAWRELALAMADLVVECDAEGCVTAAQGRLLRRLEVEPRELVGVRLADHLRGPQAGSDELGDWLTEVLDEPVSHGGQRGTLTIAGKKPVEVELWGERLPGSQTTARVALRSTSPVERERETKIRAALKRRISELERLHQKLGQADEVRARFLSASAHELKTPLTVIQSYLEILITDLSAGLGKEQLSFLTIAYESVLRLRRLVLDLVDLAAMESGRIHLDICRVEIGPLISTLVAEIKPLASRAEVRLCAVDSGPLPGVRADAMRIRQVLHNLVENAIKNTPSGGKVEIAGHVEADSVVITVRDTGIGIPADQLARIFDEYVQVRRAPEDQRPGSGLGLAICRRIAHSLGGRISVESTEGEGSAFSVHLPCWPREAARPQ